MEVKETLQILLDHGNDFINMDCNIPFGSFLPTMLDSKKWTVESIRLLIRRGAEPGRYVQPWGGCLPLAIYGSSEETPEGLRDALILLITNGADVYAKHRSGRSVTDIAYNARTTFSHNGYGSHLNDDLRLKDIWTDALAVCGYDVEEVICKSLQAAEVYEIYNNMNEDEDAYDTSEDEDEDNDSDANLDEDEDDYDIREDEDEDNDSTHEDNEYVTQIEGPELPQDTLNNAFICTTCRLNKGSINDQPTQQTWPDAGGYFDWSLLEDDTNVWRQ